MAKNASKAAMTDIEKTVRPLMLLRALSCVPPALGTVGGGNPGALAQPAILVQMPAGLVRKRIASQCSSST
jgi:hypothetical protein